MKRRPLIIKGQEGVLLSDPKTSEVVTYIDNSGNLKSSLNTQAGYVSGSDPVGTSIVEGIFLSKPLSYAGGVVGSKIKKLLDKINLPKYSRPNWKGDAVQLTKDRLKDGGFDRLTKNVMEKAELFINGIKVPGQSKTTAKIPVITNYDKKLQNKILNSFPSNPKSSEFNRRPTSWGSAYPAGVKKDTRFGVFSDAPKFVRKGQTKSDIDAHEFVHHIYTLNNAAPSKSVFSESRFPLDEIIARGPQIKNYFGLREGEELTVDMLKYASKYMVKDRKYDNDLTEFFGHILNYDEMAKYISKYSPLLIPAIYDNNR